jgi:hypothetical protein
MSGRALLLAACVSTIGVAAGEARAQAELAPPDVSERAPLGRHERDRDRHGWYVPDFAKLQVGGYLGTLGAGFGYAAFDDVLNVSAYYGFTPSHGNSDAVHAAKLDVDVRPFELSTPDVRWVPIYLGAGILYGIGGEFFTRLPARFSRIDKNYYPPTALHWLVEAGLELDYVPRRGPFERHGLYFELVALDSYVFSYVDNPDQVRLVDVVSSSVGYRAAF